MTQTTHPRGGWQQEEIDLLFSAVKEAAENGRPLRDVFSEVGGQLSRKPNSIRNFYYARVREVPQLAARQAPLRTFTAEELHSLLRDVLVGRGRGESVRACVNRLAGGDRAGMLRYQNKYRSVLKNRPEMLMEVANELRAEGLPCPDDVLACRRYNLARQAAGQPCRAGKAHGGPMCPADGRGAEHASGARREHACAERKHRALPEMGGGPPRGGPAEGGGGSAQNGAWRMPSAEKGKGRPSAGGLSLSKKVALCGLF